MGGPTCKTCRFFWPHDEKERQGFCRRYPPQIVVVTNDNKGDATWRSEFPPMLETGWCGEFQAAS